MDSSTTVTNTVETDTQVVTAAMDTPETIDTPAAIDTVVVDATVDAAAEDTTVDIVSEDTTVNTAIGDAIVDNTSRDKYAEFGNEEDNSIQLIGKILEFGAGFETDKGRYTERFQEFKLSVERISGTCDVIPIVCSEKLTFDTPIEVGDEVVVLGKLHSRTIEIENADGAQRRKTVIFCHATDLIKDVDTEIKAEETNVVELTGYICRPVRLRTTSKTGRQIADIVIAVKRPYYRKKDYIPCIAWGRNAALAGNREVGDVVKILGRIQSREKYKKDSVLPIILNEVSVTDLTVLEDIIE